MSSVYATEPATSGRVIFETTHGPLDIHLWCNECPATTKFFLQLCLDGFYDNMLFHRIVPSLLIQTGAMRSGGGNGEDPSSDKSDMMAEYRAAVQAGQALERRHYEVNARIRFNHRGQVAMALGVSDDNDIDGIEELQPQFFITTEDAPYLDGKHVVFGTLGAGPTIFNAIRICQSEVDESTNTPADMEHAPRILSAKIVENPIHDSIVPQVKLPWGVEVKAEKKKKKRTGKLDVNVLSFGDEMGDVATVTLKGKSIKSSHESFAGAAAAPLRANGSGESAAEMPRQGQSNGNVDDEVERCDSKLEATLAAADQAAAPSKPQAENGTEPEIRVEDSTKEKEVSLIEARRAKYARGRKTKQQREEETLAKLTAFRGKIHKSVAPKTEPSATRDDSLASRMARRVQQEEEKNKDDGGVTYHGQVLESDGEDDDKTWLQTRFKCRKHLDHLAGDGRDADEYQVIDDKRKNDDGDREPGHKKHKKHHHRERKEHRERK